MFCRYCGKPLRNGEECDCSEAVAARAAAAGQKEAGEGTAGCRPKQKPGAPAAGDEKPGAAPGQVTEAAAGGGPSESGEQRDESDEHPPMLTLISTPRRPGRAYVFFRNVWQCFRSYFVRPMPTLETSARILDWRTGLFWAGVLAVLTGLCGMALVKGVSLAASSYSSRAMGMYATADLAGTMIPAYLLSQLHIRYFVLFLILLAGSLLGYAGLSAVGYGWSAALHRRRPFPAHAAAVGVSTIPSACLTALAALISLLWPAAGVFLILAAAITLLVNAYVATKIVCGTDDSRLALYYGVTVAVVLTIVLLLVGHFLPPVVSFGRTLID